MKKFLYFLFFIQSVYCFGQYPYQKITGSSANFSNSRFGKNVAIDDSLALIVSDRHINSSTGPGAFFFKKTNGVWAEEQVEANPSNFPGFGVGQPYTTSGSCIALEGTQAFIGSYNYSNGEVYIYTYNGTTWSLTQTITNTANYFGRALHVDGNIMVVTSSEDSYVYEFNGTAWVQQQVITNVGVGFGTNAFVDGNHIIISDPTDTTHFASSGAVYAYEYSGGVLSTPQKLTFLTNDSTSLFGTAVSVENNKMIVGSPSDYYGNGSSKVFIYDFNGTIWQFSDTIKPAVIGADDKYFGRALSLVDGKIIVGQNGFDITKGKSYIFEYNGSIWVENNLTPPDIVTGDYHGRKISTDGKNIIIDAALDDDNGPNSGSVYIFDFCSSQGPAQNYTICNGDSVSVGSVTFYADTVYNQLLTNAKGCDSIIVHNITVNTVPSVVANASQTTICNGDSVQLTGAGAVSYTWNNGVNDGDYVSPSTTINYTVVGTGANSCTNTDQITITVNPLPTVTANATQNTICEGDSTQLTASGAVSYSWDNGVNNGDYVAPMVTTNYTVIGTGANSCTNTDQITITVNPSPSVSVANFNPDTICDNTNPVLLPVGAPSGGSYIGSGVSGTTFDPQASGAGTFNVIYTYTNGFSCTGVDTTQITVQICTGIEDLMNTQMLMTPNPFNNYLNIINVDLGSAINIFDVQGKLVVNQAASSKNIKIPTNQLISGVYFLRIVSKNKVITERIIKQ